MRDAFIDTVAAEILAYARAKLEETRGDKPKPLQDAINHLAAIAPGRSQRGERAAATRTLQMLIAPADAPTDIIPTAFTGEPGAVRPAPPLAFISAAGSVPSIPPRTTAPAAPIIPVPWRSIYAMRRTSEWAMIVIASTVALLGGAKLLWVDNLTWGTWGDVITAIVWGTGVKLGADAFAGLTWLRSAIGKAP